MWAWYPHRSMKTNKHKLNLLSEKEFHLSLFVMMVFLKSKFHLNGSHKNINNMMMCKWQPCSKSMLINKWKKSEVRNVHVYTSEYFHIPFFRRTIFLICILCIDFRYWCHYIEPIRSIFLFPLPFINGLYNLLTPSKSHATGKWPADLIKQNAMKMNEILRIVQFEQCKINEYCERTL